MKNHFAILKVGPWLTFALREAVFALANIEEEWLSGRKGFTTSRVRETLDEAMLANPNIGKAITKAVMRSFSFRVDTVLAIAHAIIGQPECGSRTSTAAEKPDFASGAIVY